MAQKLSQQLRAAEDRRVAASTVANRLGSAKVPAFATVWRWLVGCQHPVPALPVDPMTRAHARAYYALSVSTDLSAALAVFFCGIYCRF
jgi:hypothetical protein